MFQTKASIIKRFSLSVLTMLLLMVLAFTSQAQTEQLVKFQSVVLNPEFKDVKSRPFSQKRFIFPVKEKDKITGIPKGLSDYKLLHSFADRNQFFYQSYKEGSMAENMYSQMEDIREEVHTEKWLDGVLSVVIGKDKSDKLTLFVDSNNNEDFSDETALTFQLTKTSSGKSQHVAEGQVSIEYFERGKVKERTIPIKFLLQDSTDYESLAWYVPNYKEASISVKGTDYKIALGSNPAYRIGYYYFFYIDLNRDGIFDTKRGSAESYSLSEPFNLGGVGLKIKQLAQDGSSIILEEVEEEVLPKVVVKAGTAAPDFKARTLKGKSISLDALKGNFILLDFWAPSCPYCVNEIDYLIEANKAFENKLTVVGMVGDTDKAVLEAFLAKHNIDWPQVLAALDSEIARSYSVYGFPTQYLIDPKGTIIEAGASLRGDELMATLKKHIK